MFKKYFFLVYYLLLIIILQLQQSEVMPSTGIRLVFVGAVMWPLYTIRKDALPIVLSLFFTVTNYNFSYSYMPYEVYQYDILIALGLVLGYHDKSFVKIKVPIFLYVWLFSVTIIDIAWSLKINYLSYSILGMILLWPYMNFGNTDFLKTMSLCIIATGTVLASSYLLFASRYAEAYTGGGGFEREGWTDPNYFGCAVGMGIVAAGVEIVQKRYNILMKLIFGFTILIMFACLAMNASRGAILAVGASSLILILVARIKNQYKVLFALMIVAMVIYLNDLGYFDLLKYRIENDDNGGSGRTIIWITKIEAFFSDQNPLPYISCIFGLGLEEGRNLAQFRLVHTGFHNDFIAFLCEYGFVGLFIFIKWLWFPISKATSNKLLVSAVIVYLIMCSMTLEPITAGRFSYFIFWLYALQLAVSQTEIKKSIYE